MLPGPGAFLLDRSFIVDEWTTHLELGAILWENSEIVQHLLGIVEHFWTLFSIIQEIHDKIKVRVFH